MTTDVKDDTTAVVNDKEDTPVEDGKTTPPADDLDKKDDLVTDKDFKDGQARDDDHVDESEDRIQDLLDKHGFDSYEDLEESVNSLKELEGLIGKRDAKQLVEDADYLAKVKEFWKEQDELKKQEDETYEDTAKRLAKDKKELEQKLKDRDKEEASKKARREVEKNTERLISSFNTTVNAEVDKAKDLPKEYKSFLKEYLGVDNPANEIDIGLKPEIRSMAREGIKKFQDLEQVIIRRYLDGKIEVPKITTTDGSQTPVDGEKKVKSMKEARSALYEAFGVKR